MRFKFTIFLLLANFVAFGLIVFQTTKSISRLDFEHSIFSAGISKISISPSVGEKFSLQAQKKSWEISEPFVWQANAFAVRQLVAELRFLEANSGFSVAEALATGSSLADYGLENPSLVVAVTDDAGTRELKFGKETPDGKSVYALSPDGKRVIPAPKSLFLSASKSVEHFRVPEIFSLKPYEVESIVVRAPFKGGSEQRIGLVRAVREREFSEKAERIWKFETPVSADAETRLVEAKLSELVALRYKNFEKGDVALFEKSGLKSPKMRFTLGSAKSTETLLLGNEVDDDPEQIFAKLESNDAIFTVPAEKISSWRNAPTALRDAHFLRFDPNFLQSITIHGEKNSLFLLKTDFAENAPKAVPEANSGEIALENSGVPADENSENSAAEKIGAIVVPEKISNAENSIFANWQMPVAPGALVKKALPADPAAISQLVEKLRNLCAATFPEDENSKNLSFEQRAVRRAFVADFASEEEIAELNFENPVRVVELKFRTPNAAGTPNSASGAAAGTTEKIITLTIAPPVEKNSPFHAKVENAIYSIEAGILDELSVDPAFFRARAIFKISEGAQISEISLSDVSESEEKLDFAAAKNAENWEIRGNENGENLNSEAAAGMTNSSALPSLDEISALVKALENISAISFLSDEFSQDFAFDYLDSGVPETWRYRLNFSVKNPNSDVPETLEFYLTKRLGGSFQLAGNAEQNCVFRISQNLIDAIHAVTFAKNWTKDVPEVPVPASPQKK